MSGFKNILVPVGDAHAAEAPLEAAFRFASGFNSHITGLHVRVDPASAIPLVGEGMSSTLMEEVISSAAKQAANRASNALAKFEEIRTRFNAPLLTAPKSGAGRSAEWVDVVGREEEIVTWRTRLSDLVVVHKPDEEADPNAALTLNAALMEGGRPVLMVPAELPETIGRSIVIAWNGSAEAGRAVGLAMPLLQRADTISILTVSDDDRTTSAPSAELAAYLAWHGITSVAHKVAGPALDAGEAVVQGCIGADLLVMGAYTHSRLRQMLLGGATRYVLKHATMPCLMCH